MHHARLRFAAQLGVTLLAALPIVAQAGDRVPFQEKEGWAKPPIVVLPWPDVTRVGGISPSSMRSAYGFTQVSNQGAGQTIALIEAYDNPDAQSDLATFSSNFGLAACGSGCFSVVYATGTKPSANSGWAGESSLDIEWAHAIAPQAHIMLVEAASSSNSALMAAVDAAVQHGATVLSMSFGGGEFATETSSDSHFNVKGVTFCASSGDSGHGAQYPAASPLVVAVGGTALHISGGAWSSESAWSGSGGGQSKYETEPTYQSSAQSSGKRGIPDVAYDASPSTGVPVYSKYGFGGWTVVGGTSISSPQWAGLFAIANSMRVLAGKATLNQVQIDLYKETADFHDITTGSNGTCGTLCRAAKGYDFVTGLGSPKANLLIPALVAAP